MSWMISHARAALVGLATVSMSLVGSQPLAAQAEGAPAAAGEQHAAIGNLQTVDPYQKKIVVEKPRRGNGPHFRSFATTPTTSVEGLGAIGDVADIPTAMLGRLVLVTYTSEGSEAPIASRVTFLSGTGIDQTRGTVKSVDHQSLVLESSGDHPQRFDLSGAKVDGEDGLLPLSDLHSGQDVTVYYSPRAQAGAGSSTDPAFLVIEG
jgi:hypothetical protein